MGRPGDAVKGCLVAHKLGYWEGRNPGVNAVMSVEIRNKMRVKYAHNNAHNINTYIYANSNKFKIRLLLEIMKKKIVLHEEDNIRYARTYA